MKERGAQNVSQVGLEVGEALKYLLLLFPASVEIVPRIQEAEMNQVPTGESLASSLLRR